MNVRREEGVTLIELVITGALTLIVLSVIGGMLVSTITAQRTVASLSSTSDSAQVTATSIGTAIRNSSAFQLSNPTGTDQMVVARVAGQGSTITWRCQAWYFSAGGGGSLLTTTTSDGTAITAPSSAQLATWTQLLTGVTPRSGTGVFALNGSALVVSFNATAPGHDPVAIQFSSSPLTGVSEASTCF